MSISLRPAVNVGAFERAELAVRRFSNDFGDVLAERNGDATQRQRIWVEALIESAHLISLV